MANLQPQTGAIPEPFASVTSKPFWEGCKRRELLYQRCNDCSSPTWSPGHVCSVCYSRNLAWVASKGVGEVYSWTTVWRPQTPAFHDPYTAIIMRMDEGYDFLSNMINCEPDAVQVGMRAKVVFHDLQERITLPYFEPL